MKRKTKILAFILSLMMIFSVMPLSLFAADAETATVEDAHKTALEILESKHTGEIYSAPTVVGNSSVASIERDGYWNSNGSFTNNPDSGYVIKNLAANAQHNYDADGGAFAAGTALVYTITLKRGEAMPENYAFAFFKTNTRHWLQFGVRLNGDSIVFQAHVKNHWQSDPSLKAAFSTSVDTTVTMVYDNPTGKMFLYVNGILIDKADYGWSGETGHGAIYTEKLDSAISGNVMTLGKMSIYSVPSANIESVIKNTNPANGVFNVNGNYYYYENGLPVLGKTFEVDGYKISTEANTGIITDCYKPQDNSDIYDRWTASEYKANGVTLIYDDYNTSLSAPVDGYVYKTVTEGDTTYYLVDPTKTNVREHYIKITDVGDGLEISKKESHSKPYYTALPSSYEAVTDASGKVWYKTTTAPSANISLDLTYVHEFFNATATTGAANINIRLKAGPNFNFNTSGHMDVVSINCELNGANTRAVPGEVRVIDGLPHLFMSGVDCGIIRADAYTDLTIRTYLSDSKLLYDLYVNGVKLASGIQLYGATVTEYKPKYVRFYAQGYLAINEPYATFGATQLYYGDKVNNNENPYNGTKMTADGVYTYVNGIATALNKGTAADSTVGLKSYSVTLGETLGINFYATLPQNAGKAVISVGGETQEIDLTKLSKGANGFYKFSAKISSINVAEQVLVAFYDADGSIMPVYASNGALYERAYECSVKEYATYIAERARIYGDATVELVKAMLNYAAYAEKYFGKNDTLSTAYSASDAAKVTALDASKVSGVISADGADTSILKSIQLVLDNATKIRINLNSAATVESEYANVKYVEIDGRYYIDICDIDAKNLDTVYTLTVNGIAIEINVVGVASIVAGAPNIYGTDFANLMKAIYLYSEAANAVA